MHVQFLTYLSGAYHTSIHIWHSPRILWYCFVEYNPTHPGLSPRSCPVCHGLFTITSSSHGHPDAMASSLTSVLWTSNIAGGCSLKCIPNPIRSAYMHLSRRKCEGRSHLFFATENGRSATCEARTSTSHLTRISLDPERCPVADRHPAQSCVWLRVASSSTDKVEGGHFLSIAFHSHPSTRILIPGCAIKSHVFTSSRLRQLLTTQVRCRRVQHEGLDLVHRTFRCEMALSVRQDALFCFANLLESPALVLCCY